MKYQEFPPPPGTSVLVENLWVFEAQDLHPGETSHVIVPDGAVSISMLRLPTGHVFCGFTGPSMQAHRMELLSGATYAGIRLRPGTAGSTLREDVSLFRDAIGPSPDRRPALLADIGRHLPSAIEADALIPLAKDIAAGLVQTALPVDPAVDELARRIMDQGGRLPLKDLTTDLGVSERQLRRRFAYQCGLSPKEFARLRRVRMACVGIVQARQANFAQASAEAGYADQAHMSRDFRHVFGNSVGLVEHYLKTIEHGVLV